MSIASIWGALRSSWRTTRATSTSPTLFLGLPVVPGFLAKAELREVPVFGRAMEAGGHVFVDRGVHESAIAAVEAAADGVASGRSIVVFPEGTRSRRREVLPFKKGGFHLAKKAGVPLVPVGLRGSADVLPKSSRTIVGGRCEVVIGEPLEPAQIEEHTVESLLEEVRARICTLAELPPAADRSGE